MIPAATWRMGNCVKHIAGRAVTARKHHKIDATFGDRPRRSTCVFWPGFGSARADGDDRKAEIQREAGTHAACRRDDGEFVRHRPELAQGPRSTGRRQWLGSQFARPRKRDSSVRPFLPGWPAHTRDRIDDKSQLPRGRRVRFVRLSNACLHIEIIRSLSPPATGEMMAVGKNTVDISPRHRTRLSRYRRLALRGHISSDVTILRSHRRVCSRTLPRSSAVARLDRPWVSGHILPKVGREEVVMSNVHSRRIHQAHAFEPNKRQTTLQIKQKSPYANEGAFLYLVAGARFELTTFRL
jgi:hypothetical protein